MQERHHVSYIDGIESSVFAEIITSDYVDPERYEMAKAMLPPRWADVIEMFDEGKRQVEIAGVMGFTTANIWEIRKRAKTAIRFLLLLPPITEESLTQDLSELLSAHQIALLRYYWRTSCAGHVLRLLGCRHHENSQLIYARVDRYVGMMKADEDRYRDYITVFEAIRKVPKLWADIATNAHPDLARRELNPEEGFNGLPVLPSLPRPPRPKREKARPTKRLSRTKKDRVRIRDRVQVRVTKPRKPRDRVSTRKASNLWKARNGERKNASNRAWRRRNRERLEAVRRAKYQANLEKNRAKAKLRRKNPEYRRQCVERVKRWRLAHPERAKAINKRAWAKQAAKRKAKRAALKAQQSNS